MQAQVKKSKATACSWLTVEAELNEPPILFQQPSLVSFRKVNERKPTIVRVPEF